MKTKITMNSSKNLSVESAYELFIRKCRVKNLSEATITSYNNKVIPFVEFCNGGDISAVTVDTVDAFTDMSSYGERTMAGETIKQPLLENL